MVAQLESSLDWQQVGQDEAMQVYQLHRAAIRGMPDSLVRGDDLDQFMRHVMVDGLTVAGFHDGEMVAYGVLGLRSSTMHHMAELLGIQERDFERFVILDGAAVAPAWRSRGLHRQLIQARMRMARHHGRSLLAVTVAPGNVPSIRALMSEGFQVCGYSQPYADGASRLLMLLDTQAPQARCTTQIAVRTDDDSGHQAALAAGLLGHTCAVVDGGEVIIEYGHALHSVPERQ